MSEQVTENNLDNQPVNNPEPVETKPEPVETNPEPVETKPVISLEDVDSRIQAAITEALKSLKPEPQPEPQPEPEEPKMPEPDNALNETLTTLKGLLRDTLIKSYEVPESLTALIPSDPVEAKRFLSSDAYNQVRNALNYQPPAKPESKPEEPAKTETEVVRQPPGETTPKTFNDMDSKFLADQLRGLI